MLPTIYTKQPLNCTLARRQLILIILNRAYKFSPFDKNMFSKQYYPLSTLEKSADPFLVSNYKQIVVGNARKDPVSKKQFFHYYCCSLLHRRVFVSHKSDLWGRHCKSV